MTLNSFQKDSYCRKNQTSENNFWEESTRTFCLEYDKGLDRTTFDFSRNLVKTAGGVYDFFGVFSNF